MSHNITRCSVKLFNKVAQFLHASPTKRFASGGPYFKNPRRSEFALRQGFGLFGKMFLTRQRRGRKARRLEGVENVTAPLGGRKVPTELLQ